MSSAAPGESLLYHVTGCLKMKPGGCRSVVASACVTGLIRRPYHLQVSKGMVTCAHLTKGQRTV